jgi:hypothetical protein
MRNPIDNPAQIAAEDDVIALWREERVKAGRQAIGHAWKTGWADTAPDEIRPLIETYLDEYVTNWLFKGVASDTQHPRFVRDFMPAYRWHGRDVPGACTGGDNTDNTYRLAGIAHGTRYRVTGRILDREPANVTFTLVGDYGTSVTIQTLELHKLEQQSDGSFVITIDSEPAQGRLNHMTTAPHVKFLFVRDSMEDWAHETPLELHIERLGQPNAPPLTREQMAERGLFRGREDVALYHWFQCGFTAIRPSMVKPAVIARGATGGLVTQATARGHLQLGPDDAAIYDYDPAGAGYVAVQLSDWFLRSLDPKTRQSSLTQTQSHVSADGRVRLVIARQDPGVANWLDCGAFENILIMHRWQRMPDIPLRGGPHVQARMVKLDRLRAELPADTVWFTPQQRAGQIAARQAAYARRITQNPD